MRRGGGTDTMNRTEKLNGLLEYIEDLKLLGWREITEMQGFKDDCDPWASYLRERGNATKIVGNDKAGGYVLMARKLQLTIEEVIV
jgi:hypothetical protein